MTTLSTVIETDIATIDFNIDGTAAFFKQRGIPENTDVDEQKIQGILIWNLHVNLDAQGSISISAEMPGEQAVKLRLTYFVGDFGDATQTIEEDIVLKNVTIEMERSSMYAQKNQLLFDLYIDEILWDETDTLVRIRSRRP